MDGSAEHQLAEFIARIKSQAYQEGHRDGRLREHEHLVNLLAANSPAATPQKRSRGRPRQTATPITEDPAFDQIVARVQTALGELQPTNPEGVFPDAIAQHLKGSGTTDYRPATRKALRHLMMTGGARRMGRGRYLPRRVPTAAEELPDPPIAAAAE